MGRLAKELATLLILAMVWLLASTFPLADTVTRVLYQVDQSGSIYGAIYFFLIVIVATLLMFPCWLFSLTAGLLFGFGWGSVVMLVSATASAVVAMVFTRYCAGPKLTQWMRRYKRMRKLDHAVSAEGWKIVAMLRIVPLLPFNIQNYLYGLTSIRLRDYAAATFVFMTPGIALNVYIGNLMRQGLGVTGDTSVLPSQWQWPIRMLILAAALGGSWYMYVRVRRALADYTEFEPTCKEAAP